MNKETLNAACAEIPQFREKLAIAMEEEMELTAQSAYVAAKEVIGIISICNSSREFQMVNALIEAFCGCKFEALIERAKGESFKGKKEAVASQLPGWHWKDYEDGSGALYSPTGKAVYSYDMGERTYAGEIAIHNEDKAYPLPACGRFFSGSLPEMKACLEELVLSMVVCSISKAQMQKIKDSYESNKDGLRTVEAHISNHGCTDAGLSDAAESFEQGYNNGMEFIFDAIGLEY